MSTVSVFSDSGEQYVFEGSQVLAKTLWESSFSSVKLEVSVFERESPASKEEVRSRFVARVIERNLGHARSNVCHSVMRKSPAPLEQQHVFAGPSFEEVMISISKKYPNAEPCE